MSVKDFLNNFGGRSNTDRSNRNRQDYDYRSRSEPAPAIDVHGVSLMNVQLIESGTYRPEYLRPYVVTATRDDINEMADTIDEVGGVVSAGTISGISGRLMSYSNRVSDRDLVDIEGGWDERRFTFIMEVIERQRDEDDRETGREVVTFISGYTDCLDIAERNLTRRGANNSNEILLAPSTVMYVSNIRRIERDTRVIITNNQLIVPSYYKNQNYRRDRESLFTLRPRDILNNESIQDTVNYGNNSDNLIINGANNLNGSVIKTSRSANLNPATYLASSINALMRSETKVSTNKDQFGNYTGNRGSRNDVFNRAQSYIREDNAYEANSFLSVIRQQTSFQQDQTFTWGELHRMFGTDELENLTEILTFDRAKRDQRVSDRSDCADWSENENSGRNSVMATVMKQTLPAYAMESMIYACRIEATNHLSRTERMDAVDGIRVIVSDVVFAGNFADAMQDDLIRDLEDSIALDVLKDLSINNEVTFDIIVDLDWRFDSFYHVGLDGDRPITFSSAGFSGSLTSPIITANSETADSIGRDLRAIVTNALGK